MQDVRDLRLVGGRRAAPAGDEPRRLAGRERDLGVDVRERCEGEAGRADQLRERPAGPDGAVAVDARVRLRRVEQVTTAKTW